MTPDAQLDIFGHPHRRLRTIRTRTWQPCLFTTEHEREADAAAVRDALERFRVAGSDDATIPPAATEGNQ